MNFNFETIVASIVGAAVTITGGILTLRRTVSRNSLEVTKDSAGQTLVQNLLHERDLYKKEAEEAWARRVSDAEQIARLKAENDALIEKVRYLTTEDLSHRLRITNLRRALSETKPGALDDLDSNYAPID